MRRQVAHFDVLESVDAAAWLRQQAGEGHPDVLRTMVAAFANPLMSAEADAACGAEYGQRSDERVNQRNGYRPRGWDTRAGTIDLQVPKLRTGSYFPDWLLQHRRRADQALVTVVTTSYLLGVSTRHPRHHSPGATVTTLPTPTEYVERLLAVNWSAGGFDHPDSRSLLMAEHLRRTAWWAQHLHCQEWPFPDLAAYIDPTIRADPAQVEQLQQLLALAQDPVLIVAVNGLHWYTLRSQPGIVLPDLADPYLPLLMFFERGGSFTLSTGYIDIHAASVPRGNLQHHLTEQPLVTLDTAVLDQIDGS